MTKCELIDMFKNIIFPKQAEDLLKINYEGLGEIDKQEYLRDTSTLITLAEKGLKSEQELRWIPVTERLPKEEGFYLVTRRTTDDVATFIFRRTLTSKDYWKRCVIAWMPLPKSYKKEIEDKE